MVYHIEEKEDVDRSRLIDMEVFKSISGNATKQMKMQQEMRVTTKTMTRAGKSMETIIKQLPSQELQGEKKDRKVQGNNHAESSLGTAGY